MKKLLSVAAPVFLGLTLFVSPTPVSAIMFSGGGVNPETGNPVSGKATFTIMGNMLTLVLQNTTPGGTAARGDVLTGIVFDIMGSATADFDPFTGPTRGTSDIFVFKKGTKGKNPTPDTTVIDNTQPLDGSWTDQGGTLLGREFGVATTGFNGAFAAGNITRGNADSDYGNVAAGTFTNGGGTFDGFNAGAFPLAQDSLTFKFTITGTVVENDIKNVAFLFGTSGEGSFTNSQVPEPGSLVLAGSVLAALGCLGWIRRRGPSSPSS